MATKLYYYVNSYVFGTVYADPPEDLFMDAPSPEDYAEEELHEDHTPLSYGKYQGLTPEQIATKDPGWLVWAKKNVTNKPVCSDALYRDCLKSPLYLRKLR